MKPQRVVQHRGVMVRPGYSGDYGAVNEAVLGGYHLGELVPPKRVVDVGAHIGSFAVDCLRRWPGCEVVCIEPNTRNIPMLKLNTQGEAVIVQAAVCYELEPLLENAVYRNGNSGGSRLVGAAKVERPNESYRGVSRVRGVTLEEVLADVGWFSVDLLKLDCEGAEVDILEHADLSRYGAIVGEYHDREAFLSLMSRAKIPLRLELWPPLTEMGLFRFR